MYDAIVVGARCAGSPAAMLLARKGHRVLLLDRARFPSDTLSTHFIQLPGVARLARWGILDRVVATGAPTITEGRLDIDGNSVTTDFPVPAGLPGLNAPRRTVLDEVLVDAAVAAGAELREGVMIDSVIIKDGRVVGVRGHGPEGPTLEERARIVVGADGRNSIVARSVGAEFLEHTDALGGGYYSYWGGVECPGAELYLHEGLFTAAFPTNDGLTTIAIVMPTERFREVRKDEDRKVPELLDTLGDLGTRLRAGRRKHQLVRVGSLPNFVRNAAGPGWALVGDAAYHKDPTPADGITDAYRGADLLAAAIDDYLSERAGDEDALDRYRRELEAAARPRLDKTIGMSSFDRSAGDRATAFLEIQQLHADEASRLMTEGERATAPV